MSIYGQVGHKERVDWLITRQIVYACALISSLLLFLQWYLYCVVGYDWREWGKMLADLPLPLWLVCVLVGLVDIWLCNKLLNKGEKQLQNAVQRISEVSYKTFYKRFRQYKNIFQAHFSAQAARFAVFFALHRLGDRGDPEDNNFSASGARHNQLN